MRTAQASWIAAAIEDSPGHSRHALAFCFQEMADFAWDLVEPWAERCQFRSVRDGRNTSGSGHFNQGQANCHFVGSSACRRSEVQRHGPVSEVNRFCPQRFARSCRETRDGNPLGILCLRRILLLSGLYCVRSPPINPHHEAVCSRPDCHDQG